MLDKTQKKIYTHDENRNIFMNIILLENKNLIKKIL